MLVCTRRTFLGRIAHFVVGGINHDPDIFEDPESFNPDRYLRSEYGTKPGVDDNDFRHTLIFGAGRVSPHNRHREKHNNILLLCRSAFVLECI